MQEILPLDQIESDVSRAAKYLLDSSSSIPEKVFNAKTDDFKTFYLYHHLKNATESLGELKLPGLPSVRELTDINSLEFPEIPLNPLSLFDKESVNNISSIPPSRSSSIPPSRSLLNDTFFTNDEDNNNTNNDERNVETMNYGGEEDEENSELTSFSFELPQLPQLPTLPDLKNVVTATKIIPRLIPFVVADYKDKVAGWLEGTEVKETELSDIHSTLVSWHKHLGKYFTISFINKCKRIFCRRNKVLAILAR